jgi:hypothetical protein
MTAIFTVVIGVSLACADKEKQKLVLSLNVRRYMAARRKEADYLKTTRTGVQYARAIDILTSEKVSETIDRLATEQKAALQLDSSHEKTADASKGVNTNDVNGGK